MNGLLHHLKVSLQLHLRNKMALLYGYLFPLIFLIAFWVLYRHEKVPLLRHMGELLTVSVLGGACFGLPTTLVSERERGVWRRFRLAPIPTWAVVMSTILARYIIILSAGLVQLGAALALGMTFPAHPFDLWVTFTFVSFAFIGLGLVIAMMADNVPAVQALGQCIFLPMLIIGGVAVPLSSLPSWAQHVSVFFPGRYAVEALQTSVTGQGIMGARFSLLALALIGTAGCLAGAKLFRWDAQQRFASRTGKVWLVPVFAAWLAVGWLAESRGRVAVSVDAEIAPKPALPAPSVTPAPPLLPEPAIPIPAAPATPAPPVAQAVPGPPTPVAEPMVEKPRSSQTIPAVPRGLPPPPPWALITMKDVNALDFYVPSDQGVVAPIGPPEEAEDFLKEQIESVRIGMGGWAPANSGDDLQNVRNLLCIAAVPDAIQLPVERYLPLVVLQHLQDTYDKDKLTQILTWIVQHPEDGTVVDNLADFGIEGGAGDPGLVRERSYLYAIKFIMRLTGRVKD